MSLELFDYLEQTFSPASRVVLTGERNLSLAEVIAVARHRAAVAVAPTETVRRRLETIHQKMLEQVRTGVAIYGVSSAYGGQADRVLNDGDGSRRLEDSQALSAAIGHVDVSTGPPLPPDVTRAALLIRLNMLLPGYSAVRLSTLEKLQSLLNERLTPVVGQYGTLGASGDLAQNGRVLSVLRHDQTARVTNGEGEIVPAAEALRKANIDKLVLEPKEGLGLVNGDNFSTAITVVQLHETVLLFLLNLCGAALTVQALKGSNRNFHPLLSALRSHPGQTLISGILRVLLDGSGLALDELRRLKPRPEDTIIQDGYSIRCLPQYYGPDWETLESIYGTVRTNLNSVSDNPLWTTPEHAVPGEEPYQWVSGGNFLAMYMSESLDRMRKILIHIVKQNDRHLSRLINPFQNRGLPPNLSDEAAVSQCTFKGLQTQMGMYEVYASILATPVSTAFGIHEELNQDLTSHALTSAILNWEVLRLTRLALATNLIAACQAVDLRGGPDSLSPATQPFYEWVRTHVPYVRKEQPLGHFVELIAGELLAEAPSLLPPVLDDYETA